MIYLSILLLVVVTIIFGKVSVKMGFSLVVGQLLSGVVLGASFLNVVQTSDLMHDSSETGVC